jgi:hypothetical protein
MKRIPKVQVVNFPQKDKWDKLQIIVTILSLFVAIVSLFLAGVSTYLYVREISKKPDIGLSLHSPTPALGKAIFKFDKSEWSLPLELNVGLHNSGDKKSESLSKLWVFFDKDVKVSLKKGSYWREETTAGFKRFYYTNHNLVVSKKTNTFLGVLELRVPKRSKKILIALFIIEGDFDRKSGLLYYDYINEKYSIEYHEEKETMDIWNNHLR